MSMTAPNTRGPRLEASMRGTVAGRHAIRIHRAITRNVERWYDDEYDHATFTARQGRLWRFAEVFGCVDQVTALIRAWIESEHHLDGAPSAARAPRMRAPSVPTPPRNPDEVNRYDERCAGPEGWS